MCEMNMIIIPFLGCFIYEIHEEFFEKKVCFFFWLIETNYKSFLFDLTNHDDTCHHYETEWINPDGYVANNQKKNS